VTSTRALVVAVERYDVSDRWDLDGPAADARRTVELLIDRGVDPAGITLLASPLPANEHFAAGLPVQHRPATAENIRTALVHQIRTAGDEMLFLHWGGHGVIDGKDNRRLFVADAHHDDLRNLDLTGLLRSLRTRFFPTQQRQLVLIDACQTLVHELKVTHDLPTETLPTGTPVPGRQQDVILAARPGQYAANDDARRTGVFTDIVLSELATRPWPPDPGTLFAAVRDRMDQNWQTPYYLWWQLPDGTGTRLTAPAPAGPRPAVPGPMPLTVLGAMTDAMLAMDEIADSPNRRQVILLMNRKLRGAIPDALTPHGHVVGWIRTCHAWGELGRAEFRAALRMGVADQQGVERVLAIAAEVWPPPAAGTG
jgi:hypothetical protein